MMAQKPQKGTHMNKHGLRRKERIPAVTSGRKCLGISKIVHEEVGVVLV